MQQSHLQKTIGSPTKFYWNCAWSRSLNTFSLLFAVNRMCFVLLLKVRIIIILDMEVELPPLPEIIGKPVALVLKRPPPEDHTSPNPNHY